MVLEARVPLAWRNLTEHRWRLTSSVAGTAFAVTLMFMQNGFRQAMLDSMVQLVERLDGEVMLVSRSLYSLALPYHFPYRRLVQARGIEGVVGSAPVTIVTRTSFWRNPENGRQERITVIGVNPEDDVIDLEELRASRNQWRRPDTALADTLSRRDRFGTFAAGQSSELSGRRIEIVGTFHLGINSQSNGNLILSERTLAAVFPEHRAESSGDRPITIGVLRVRSGADPARIRDRLQTGLPPDVRVLTRDQLIARERAFWDRVAPVGTVFSIGVVMGFIVGSVICYQVLFADISDRIGEFATLKAIGYGDLQLFGTILLQGFYLALMGYAAGLGVSLGLFRWVREATGLPLDLAHNDPFPILGLTLAMCLGSAALAARKLLTVDPAQLFA